MKDIHKRYILFIFGCLIIRFLIVYLVSKVDKKYLPYLGYVGLIPAFGFLIIYLFGLRKTGRETFGNKIWWNSLRPLHSLLYFIFSYMAIKGNRNSYILLLIDVIIGGLSFFGYHFLKNFK